MEKYVVRITEVLSRDIIIEANDMSEAIDMVSNQYYNEDIQLDYGDYLKTDFECIGKEN